MPRHQHLQTSEPIQALPGVSGDTNDRDGAAGEANGDVHIPDDDSQESEQGCDARGASLLNAVAALDRASGALSALGGCGSGDGS